MTAVLYVGRLDVGRGKESRDLVRLSLSKARGRGRGAGPLAAESIATERGVASEKIAKAEGLVLHAGAFNGIPDPVLHLNTRAMGIVTGLAMVGPDRRAPKGMLRWTRRFRSPPGWRSSWALAVTA